MALGAHDEHVGPHRRAEFHQAGPRRAPLAGDVMEAGADTAMRQTAAELGARTPGWGVLTLADRTEVVTQVGTDDDVPFLRPGDTVQVSWQPGAAYLLPGWPPHADASGIDVDEVDEVVEGFAIAPLEGTAWVMRGTLPGGAVRSRRRDGRP